MTDVRCTDAPCRSPTACGGFGYCRNRNLYLAGHKACATYAMKDEWRRMDSYGDVYGVYAANNDLRASFSTQEEAIGYINDQPEGFAGLSVYKLGEAT